MVDTKADNGCDKATKIVQNPVSQDGNVLRCFKCGSASQLVSRECSHEENQIKSNDYNKRTLPFLHLVQMKDNINIV